jgi:hypothetical protein
MKLSGSTKVLDLLAEHPFLESYLITQSPKFEMLKNRMARATIGRLATLRAAAGIANLDLNDLLRGIARELEHRAGVRPELAEGAAPGLTRDQRRETLKQIIAHLHDGGDLEQAKRRFAETVEDVEASEIARMEEELIREGLPVAEVQRLCDVHVGAFRPALDGHAPIEAPPGHPIHTYMKENERITALAEKLVELARTIGSGEKAAESVAHAVGALDELLALENHCQRKEHQLFPLLERHGVTGPSQVMWAVHDQIRASLKRVSSVARSGDTTAFAAEAPALARDVVEMVYKEEKILFPMSLELLSEGEWAEVRRGEDELGYALSEPAAAWPAERAATRVAPPAQGLDGLMTGDISLDQVNLIFGHLPVDLSFVDEHDTVRFYSEGLDRIFPRTPAAIGRKVQNCHPPKSVHMVEEILASFRAGSQSVAEFWLELQGRFVHIRYFAVRDRAGAYRGCLEVSQDVTAIRKLEGQRRLLDWAKP